jgi:uncharacterized protein (DUF2267 family)
MSTGADVGRTTQERVRRAVEDSAVLPAGVPVEPAITSVMTALLDRLTPGQAHAVVEALPPWLHGLVRRFEEAPPSMPDPMDRAELVARVAAELAVTPAHAEAITNAVVRAVRDELPDAVVDHVAHQLPADLQALWLAVEPLRPPPGKFATDPRSAVEEHIEQCAHLPPGVTARAALTAVTSAFTARLSGGEAWDLLLGLPQELRPILEQPLVARGERARVFDRHELVSAVADQLEITPTQAESIVPAVLAALKRVLPAKEIDDVASQLPTDLREAWLWA